MNSPARPHFCGPLSACAALLLLLGPVHPAASGPPAAGAAHHAGQDQRDFAQELAKLRATPPTSADDRRAQQTSVAALQQDWGESLTDARPAEALPHFQAALAIDRVLRAEESGYDLYGEANCYEGMGQHAQAAAAYRQALADFKMLGDTGAKAAAEAGTCAGLGASYTGLKRPAKALPLLRQALTVFQKAGDMDAAAIALAHLGDAYAALHQTAQAIGFYRQALPLFRQGGSKAGEVAALANIGEAYAALHRPAQALPFYRRALPLLEQTGDAANLAELRADIRAAQRQLKGHGSPP